MTSLPVELFILLVRTARGEVYEIPAVDIKKCTLEPQLSHDQYLQILNDDFSTISIPWSVVTQVSSLSAGGEEKTIWTSNA